MRRLALAPVLLALVATACGSSTSAPTSPSANAQGPVAPSSGGGGSGGAGTDRIEGRVQALPPATPASTFTVDGRTIKTDASTQFRRGSAARSFADLRVGMEVEARGQLTGATLLATIVELEDEVEAPPPPAPPAPENEVEFSGTVSGLTGSAGSFQFTVGSRVVRGDNATVFRGERNAPASFADLKNGASVEVKGLQRTGFVQATRIDVEEEENEPEPEPEPEAEVQGTVAGLHGTCPSIAFTVGARPVTTSSSTRFDDVSCATLKNNDRVEVRGTSQKDGSIAAARVEKK